MRASLFGYCLLVISATAITYVVTGDRLSKKKRPGIDHEAIQRGVQPISTFEINLDYLPEELDVDPFNVEKQGLERWRIETRHGEIKIFNPGDVEILRAKVWDSAFSEAKVGGQQLEPALYSILDDKYHKITSGNAVCFMIRSKANQRLRGRFWDDVLSDPDRAISFDGKDFESSDAQNIFRILKRFIDSGHVTF